MARVSLGLLWALAPWALAADLALEIPGGTIGADNTTAAGTSTIVANPDTGSLTVSVPSAITLYIHPSGEGSSTLVVGANRILRTSGSGSAIQVGAMRTAGAHSGDSSRITVQNAGRLEVLTNASLKVGDGYTRGAANVTVQNGGTLALTAGTVTIAGGTYYAAAVAASGDTPATPAVRERNAAVVALMDDAVLEASGGLVTIGQLGTLALFSTGAQGAVTFSDLLSGAQVTTSRGSSVDSVGWANGGTLLVGTYSGASGDAHQVLSGGWYSLTNNGRFILNSSTGAGAVSLSVDSASLAIDGDGPAGYGSGVFTVAGATVNLVNGGSLTSEGAVWLTQGKSVSSGAESATTSAFSQLSDSGSGTGRLFVGSETIYDYTGAVLDAGSSGSLYMAGPLYIQSGLSFEPQFLVTNGSSAYIGYASSTVYFDAAMEDGAYVNAVSAGVSLSAEGGNIRVSGGEAAWGTTSLSLEGHMLTWGTMINIFGDARVDVGYDAAIFGSSMILMGDEAGGTATLNVGRDLDLCYATTMDMDQNYGSDLVIGLNVSSYGSVDPARPGAVYVGGDATLFNLQLNDDSLLSVGGDLAAYGGVEQLASARIEAANYWAGTFFDYDQLVYTGESVLRGEVDLAGGTLGTLDGGKLFLLQEAGRAIKANTLTIGSASLVVFGVEATLTTVANPITVGKGSALLIRDNAVVRSAQGMKAEGAVVAISNDILTDNAGWAIQAGGTNHAELVLGGGVELADTALSLHSTKTASSAGSLPLLGGLYATSFTLTGASTVDIRQGTSGAAAATYDGAITLGGAQTRFTNAGDLFLTGAVRLGGVSTNLDSEGARTAGGTLASTSGRLVIDGTVRGVDGATAALAGDKAVVLGTLRAARGVTFGETATVTLAGGEILRIEGDLETESGSRYEAGFDGSRYVNAASLIQVSGSATLAAGTVIAVQPTNYLSLDDSAVYPILTAGGTLTDYGFTTEGLTSSALVSFSPYQEGNSIVLASSVTDPSSLKGLGRNQTAVADAMDGFRRAFGSNPDSDGGRLLYAMYELQTTDEVKQALTQLAAEDTASLVQHQARSNIAVHEITRARLDFLRALKSMPEAAWGSDNAFASDGGGWVDPEHVSYPNRYWATGYGSWTKQKENKDIGGVDYQTYGVVIGYDRVFDRLTAGFDLSVGTGTAEADGVSSKTDTDNLAASIYGSIDFGQWFVNFDLIYSKTWNEVRRHYTLPISGSNRGRYQADTWSPGIEVGREYRWADDNSRISATVGMRYIALQQEGFRERKGGAFDREFQDADYRTLEFPIGFALSHRWETDGGWTLTPEARARYIVSTLDDQPELKMRFTSVGGDWSTIVGGDVGRSRLQLGVGITAAGPNETDLFLRYDLEWRKKYVTQILSGGFGRSF